MLTSGNKFASLLVILFLIAIASVGIANAQNSNNSLEEKTSISVQKFEKDPVESAKKIISDYFLAFIQKKGSDGTALINYKIINIDTSDLNDVKVSVKLTYADNFDYPPVEYHVVKKSNSYQVNKQFCAFDMITDSPTRGTVRCSSDGSASI
ncbi:hypothetical protein [Paenibacillus nasutitermitis]|uniref:Uncharacterized protein n=1 Tax=Paenibacillus nasutitermitis TaxID=1652958 RepID=A0A916YYF0_9BACL|nr:hypothetical protein [Paenibacillus nasutitermitis]GGD66988.1 hypothetical protein GCM10010911_25940 [Paenibacillus nasutitermitis]